MQGNIIKIWNLLFWALTLLVSLNQTSVAGESEFRIGIVKSSDNSYYNNTIQTLINQANRAVKFRVIDIQSDAEQVARVAESDLIVSLGAQATNEVSSRFPQKNLISAYLTAQQFNSYALSSQYHLAVLLDQPLIRYLAFSQVLLDPEKIGLINFDLIKPNTNQQKFLLKHGLVLNQIQVKEPASLLPGLRQLIRQNSSLLMLPDQRIYNQKSLKSVLLTTYRSRIPIISYSPAHVKSGALASIYSSPENIGTHLGDLLNQFIESKSLPSDNPIFAKYYSIAINSQVARALNLSLPDTDQLKLDLQQVLQ